MELHSGISLNMNIDPEIIGFIAGGLSSLLFVPQIIKIIREKSAEEISLLTCIVGVVSSSLWLWFGIEKESRAMIVTNVVAVLATVLLMTLKLKYHTQKD